MAVSKRQKLEMTISPAVIRVRTIEKLATGSRIIVEILDDCDTVMFARETVLQSESFAEFDVESVTIEFDVSSL